MDLAAAAAGDRVTRMSLSPEQLADVGGSDLELCGLNDYASTGSGPTPMHGTRSHFLCQSPGHVPGTVCCLTYRSSFM